jgi:hypothetical protein
LKRLVILSDINGLFLAEKQFGSSKLLNLVGSVDELNSLELAGIEKDGTKEARHKAFLDGGIDAAVEKLIERYPTGLKFGLGLSIGGVILWKAALRGLSVDNMVCFSSTRLRFETNAPSGNTHLFFGEKDDYRPETKWFKDLGLSMNLIPNTGHEFYRGSIGLEIFHRELQKQL